MKYDYDIVIVGGGLVGLSLACALGGSGLRIAVVEPKTLRSASGPSYDVRTLALAYGSSRIFTGMGLWGEIAARGACAIKRIHISDRGHFGIARLDAADAGIAALGYVVELRVLGAVLQQALQKLDSVSLLCPATVKTMVLDREPATVLVEQNGESRSVSTRLIVGADGGRSRVREAAGIGARTVDYDQSAVVTTVTPGRAHDHVAYERFTDSGPLALLPMGENRCAVVWSALRSQVDNILAWDERQFLQRLQERFGDRLGRFTRVGARQAYPLSRTRVEEHVCARMVLIGNAAHTVHPVAGQGFNLGLRDVATLSQVLVDATRAGEDIGDVLVLGRYMRQRRRDTQAVTAFTDGLIRVFSNSFGPLVLARDLGLVITDLLPPVKRALIRRTSGLGRALPRLARGLPLAGER
ncbi:MAG: 2-octaprenyl-6-methoxyphenyl hydroxylase [Gammaproteobacteria bacterium]|nr:MAG: 2-octaprenyl-6-methoxyphenyl hydroxylase [Gammaproteobacteria bacterium]